MSPLRASARTRSLGVIGWPVAHSLSPVMQEAAFEALGLDWRYGGFAVPPEALVDAVRGASALGFVGLNVTVPHKEAVLACCVPDEAARRIGAVNTLVFGDRGEPAADVTSDAADAGERAAPRGLNTDLYGFQKLLEEARIEAKGARALVLGAGGAARAVVLALVDAGAHVTVVTRSDRRVRFAEGPPLPHVPWEPSTFAALLPECELLVDTTPRGLDDEGRFDLGALPRRAAVVDIAARAETPLVLAARARGLVAATGEAMLLHQGAAALEAWSGRKAPVEVMRRALAEALRA